MSSLRELLNTLPEQSRLLTVQPGGNYGDSLIYLGFLKLLDGNNITHTSLNDRNIRNDAPREIQWADPRVILALMDRAPYLKHRLISDIDIVYIHGGGNFSDITARHTSNHSTQNRHSKWGGGIKCFRTIIQFFNCPVVVGPQSCVFEDTVLDNLFHDVTNSVMFYCREKYTHEIISEAALEYENIETRLSKDTALYLTADDLPVDELTEEYTLLALRNDGESIVPKINQTVELPVVSRDISKAEADFSEFVDRVARAKTIHTDRLHVAILGAILDKEIIFYDNAYHKNRGVYEYALSDYTNISFQYLR